MGLNKNLKFFNLKEKQRFHLVDSSLLPIVTGFSVMLVVMSFIWIIILIVRNNLLKHIQRFISAIVTGSLTTLSISKVRKKVPLYIWAAKPRIICEIIVGTIVWVWKLRWRRLQLLTLFNKLRVNLTVFAFSKAQHFGFEAAAWYCHFVDVVSLCLLVLTTLIMPVCLYSTTFMTKARKEFICLLLIIEYLRILSFYTIDLFLYFIFFESILIPMFILIGFWGSRDRKIKADFYFFLYTLFGSLFLLFGILYATIQWLRMFWKYETNYQGIWLRNILPIEITLFGSFVSVTVNLIFFFIIIKNYEIDEHQK